VLHGGLIFISEHFLLLWVTTLLSYWLPSYKRGAGYSSKRHSPGWEPSVSQLLGRTDARRLLGHSAGLVHSDEGAVWVTAKKSGKLWVTGQNTRSEAAGQGK